MQPHRCLARAAAASLAAAVAVLSAAAACAAPPAAAATTVAPPRATAATEAYEAALRRKGLIGSPSDAPPLGGQPSATVADAGDGGGGGGGPTAAAGSAAGAAPSGAPPRSRLPSSLEADTLMSFDRDLFTDEGWDGMARLQKYARYVEALQAAGAEEAPGCDACTANRLLLEQAWQTCAAEFFDPKGRFTQGWWAEQLLDVLQARGGTLRTGDEARAAVTELVMRLGDRYSAFLPPSEFRRATHRPLPQERSYLAAQLIGVGLQLGDLSPSGGRLVEAPLAESPAEAAGIQRGDRLLSVDGVPAERLSQDQTAAALRGPAGSEVEVAVAQRDSGASTSSRWSGSGGHRGGGGAAAAAPRTLVLERRALAQPPVASARLPLPDGRAAAYIRVRYFDSAATAALRREVARWEADGAAGFVIDLRNNAGGVFEEAVASAALFLEPPADIAETVRAGSPQVIDAVWRAGALSPEVFPDPMSRAGPLTGRPMAVLINSGSASASEVLAGALHDNRRALLIGERSFGKGVVQYFFPMGEDGGGLQITVSKYLTPSRFDISLQGGLPPDVACGDFPHGILTPGGAPDACTAAALDYLAAASGRGAAAGAPPAAPRHPLFAGQPVATGESR